MNRHYQARDQKSEDERQQNHADDTSRSIQDSDNPKQDDETSQADVFQKFIP